MGEGGGSSRISVRAAGVLVALGLTLALAAPAAAHARRFPVPRCGWVTASMIDHSFGLQVNATKGAWKTLIAPVLSCSFVEQHARLQAAGDPIVLVQFREIQRFRPGEADVFVPHLGSCVKHFSCPRSHKPAWLYVHQAADGMLPTPFSDATVLAVQDGLDSIVIEVANPFGPVPVANESAAVEQLARKLLPRFRWK
jgi:hypothetical protein